ncbi:MAG TPA: ATP-dependent DNA helicase RecQ [Flavitalea sp.]|nr:ATP-dependent DNA helicase RecQ [Flavitalea sp.]
MSSIQQILKDYWGFNGFRPLQEDIINSVLQGNDCLALLPTGGGKSLCFQVPAMLMDGICLVITPLIALMKDQVENVRKKGITAFFIHSGMTRNEVVSTMETAAHSNCKFLYVSPERLETKIFKEYLPSLGVKLIAVDEAHCISQWGYDFRPSYLRIAALREELNNVPVLALTASATPEVQKDICEKLLFTEQKIFQQSFERPNLSYSVFNVDSKINKIENIFSKVEGTGIVYCRSRRKTKEISDLLNMKGVSADYYHAGLTQDERNEKQEAWLTDKIRVIVCTNAFGMGIDKPAVRVVVHADVPESLENYYQEAGRAGRDGKRSYAVLLSNQQDLKNLEESAAKRFPAQEDIRKAYKSLMNHLQIPAGTGEGNYYELDAPKFIKDFGLDAGTVLSALKTLEQEELLYFNEQVFIQPKIQVIAGREQLSEIEKRQPHLEPLIKTILRSYEGVLDQPVYINEKSIAAILKRSDDEIRNQLIELHKNHIVEYAPRKEKPQVYLFQNRIIADDLKINASRYNKQKKQFESRVKAMRDYVNSYENCRSIVIGKYFGDDHLLPCGICDNCINKKKKETTSVEFAQLSSSVICQLSSKPITINDLIMKMKPVSKDKIKQVVKFLQAEETLVIDESGIMSLKNTSFTASSSQP